MTLGNCSLCGRTLTNDELQAETVPIMALIVGGPTGVNQVCDHESMRYYEHSSRP